MYMHVCVSACLSVTKINFIYVTSRSVTFIMDICVGVYVHACVSVTDINFTNFAVNDFHKN